MGPDSDIDVLVVMPDGVHRRQTAQLLYRQIRGLGVPFDILVATPDDLERHKDNIGLIYQSILRGRERSVCRLEGHVSGSAVDWLRYAEQADLEIARIPQTGPIFCSKDYVSTPNIFHGKGSESSVSFPRHRLFPRTHNITTLLDTFPAGHRIFHQKWNAAAPPHGLRCFQRAIRVILNLLPKKNTIEVCASR